MAFYLGKDKQKVIISEAMLGGTVRPTQPKQVTYIKNGNYSVKPDSGYVLSNVDISVNVPERYDEGLEDGKVIGREEGYNEGKTDGIAEGVASVKIQPEKTTTENGTIEPDSPYVALKKVVVNVPERYKEGFENGRLEGYEEGYQAGLDVNDFVTGALEVDENNTYYPSDYNVDGFSSVTVAVPDRYNDGVEDGKEIGRNEGYNEGKTDGIAEGKASIKFYEETITESGSYTVEPKEGFNGFSSVIVDVKDRYQEGYDEGSEDVKSNLYNLEANENKTYTPEEYNVDGFGSVTVAVPEREPVLEPLTATENKTYTAPETIDGYSSVVVQVPLQYDEGYEDGKADGIAEGVASIKIQSEKEAKENGAVEPDEGFDGLAKVIVAVPQKTEVDLEETITENHKTFTYEPEDGETFKKVIINVNVPTEIEGEFNGVALLESGECGESINYNIYDNGWVVLEGTGDTYDYEEVYDDESGEFLGYNSPFLNNAFITHVYIADDITMVGTGLFLNCTNIEEVRLPDGLRSIGVSAFENTGISKIYLPNSIMGVELDAFYGCSNLTDVYYNGTKDDWHSFWDGSGFGADVAIFEAGLADVTLHCEYEEPLGGGTPTTTEIWTFEMENGSIVTKEVVVVC